MLTEPALTRLRASHPCVLLAGIVNNSDVVFVQNSGGRELILNPGLNIIGGMQPRGVNEFIPGGIPDIVDVLDISIVDELTAA